MSECEHLNIVPVFTISLGQSAVPKDADGAKCKDCGEEVSLLGVEGEGK